MIHYVCKYTPLELLKVLARNVRFLREMPENFELSDQIGTCQSAARKIRDPGSAGRERLNSLFLLIAVIPCAVCTTLWKAPVKCKFCTCWTCRIGIMTVKEVKLAQGIHRLRESLRKIFRGKPSTNWISECFSHVDYG